MRKGPGRDPIGQVANPDSRSWQGACVNGLLGRLSSNPAIPDAGFGSYRKVPCGTSELPKNEHKGDVTLDGQLCFAIYKNSNKLARLYREHLKPHGLTFPLYLVLIVLWEHAPCPVGRIVQELDLETSTVTPLLKRLQALGYVSRTRDHSDERRVTITLTEQGHALRARAVAMRTEIVERTGMTYEKIVELRTTLHLFSDVIDDLMAPKRASGRKSRSSGSVSPTSAPREARSRSG